MHVVVMKFVRNSLQSATHTPNLPFDNNSPTTLSNAQTCCARNHDFGDGPGTAACDLDAVRPVLDAMIDAKVGHFWGQGITFDARAFTCLKRILMRGFDENVSAESKENGDSNVLEAARAMFRWRGEAVEEAETKRTGIGLLFWCAASDNTDAVRALLAEAASPPAAYNEQKLLIHRADIFSIFLKGVGALHMAAVLGTCQTVELLLDAGANPQSKSFNGFTVITMAATGFVDPQTIRMWGRRFPDWDWDRGEPKLAGGTTMSGAIQWGVDKRDVIAALVSVGASLTNFRVDTGSHALVYAAANPDISEETLRYLLTLPGVKDLVDEPMRPTKKKWWFRFKLTRLLTWLGSKRALIRTISLWEGQTALCSAALNGNAVAMNVLVRDAGANTQLRNARGLTALDQARLVNGSQYFHPLLAAEKFISDEEEEGGVDRAAGKDS